MQYKKYIFVDPTGGGEDAELTLPIWAKPPMEIQIRMEDDTLDYFEIDNEEGEDVE